jgi:hypothetical protein
VRHVEVSDQVFWALEAIFSVASEDRPTQSEFTSHELFPARDYFAEHWDDAAGRLVTLGTSPMRKMLHVAGRHVHAYDVVAQELPDGTIEMIGISIDFEGLPDPGDD